MDIGEGYIVIADSDNVILQRRRLIYKGVNKGKETIETLGYYSTIKSALRGFVNMEIMATGIETFEAVDKRMDELFEIIANLDIREPSLV